MRGLMRQWLLGAMVALALGGAWAQDHAAAGRAAAGVEPENPLPASRSALAPFRSHDTRRPSSPRGARLL